MKQHYFRDGGVWLSGSTVYLPQPSDGAEFARTVDESQPRPGVTWFNWKAHVYEEKPFKHIRDFFLPTPFGLAEVQDIQPLRPNTPEFWQDYGEPLKEFADWCEMFASCVGYMSEWEGGKAKGEDAARMVQQSHWALSGLAQSAAPSFRLNTERNAVEEVRVSAGLLASYALMFLWDRMERRRALRCQNCGRYFVSNEHRARYCSPRCRNTAQSRRHRANKENVK